MVIATGALAPSFWRRSKSVLLMADPRALGPGALDRPILWARSESFLRYQSWLFAASRARASTIGASSGCSL